MKFLSDEDFNQKIVNGFRSGRPTIDFLTAIEAGLSGRKDDEVLKSAAESDRVLLTHDRNTMLGHFARFLAAQSSPGLIVVSQNLVVGAAIEQLVLVCECMDAKELANTRLFIPM